MLLAKVLIKQCNLLFLLLFFLSSCSNKINFIKEFEQLQKETFSRTCIELSYDKSDFINIDKQQFIDNLLSRPISRSDAVTIALLNNKRIQVFFEDLGVAKADLVQASLFTNPLALAVWFFHLSDAPKAYRDAGFEFRWLQDISDFWQIPFNKKLKKDALYIALLNIVEEVIKTVSKTKKIYDEMLYSRAQLNNTKNILKEIIYIKSLVTSNIKPDKNKTIKKNTVQLLIEEWKLRIIEFEAEYKSADVELKKMLGLICPPVQILKLSSSLKDAFINLPELKVLQDTAFCYSPAIQKTTVKIKQFEDAVKFEKSRILDKFYFGFEVAREFENQKIGGPSLYINAPFFDQNQAQIARAYFLIERAKKELVNIKLNVNSQIAQLIIQFNATIKRIEIFRRKILKLSEELISLVKNGNGIEFAEIGWTTQSSLFSLRIDYTRLFFRALNIISDLEKAIGKRICY